MKDLKLNMPIWVTSTCYLNDVIFELKSTTLADAYNSSSSSELQIKLPDDGINWGACWTRNRSQVAINEKEVKDLANRMLAKHRERVKDEKPKSRIYYLEGNGRNFLEIKTLTRLNVVNSLAEGSYVNYGGVKIYDDKLPHLVFYNLDDAINKFVELASIKLNVKVLA